MSYTIVWEIAALGALRRLRQIDPAGAKQLHESIDALTVDPQPAGSAPLGDSGFWRLRVDDYRATYRVEDTTITVHVINVGRVRS